MPDPNEKIIEELKGVFQRLNVVLERQNDLLASLVEHQKKRDEKQEQVIAKEFAIAGDDYKQFDAINNPGFNRARIFLDAGFTPAHSGGLSVVMVYKNSPMGEVLKVLSSNGSAGKASSPIDTSQLSGFSFIVNNRDKSNSTTVKNFRIVLYNEVRA